MASDAIKEAWMKLMYAEECLARGVMEFLPRVRWEDTHPTFEHPEDWDSLSVQEKANLIVADKAVKLMELQCWGSATGHQKTGITTNHESGPPDRKPKNLGGDAKTDVVILPIQATNTHGGAINLYGL